MLKKMKESTEKSRRDFIKTASKGVLFAAVAPTALQSAVEMPTVVPQKAFGANERIRIAVLGLNSRGQNHVDELMALATKSNVEIVMFCDPDMEVLQRRANEFKTKHGKTVLIEQDFRKAYDDKTIDAVTIASPNHWHALQAIWACQAGKDVYVEKPATHNLFEGRKMIEAAYKYNRIVQHGVQLRSSIAIREAVKHLEDGLIGNVYMARGLVFRQRADIGNKGISQTPSTLNYDLWCGPAPMRPFSKNYVHYNWHWHWDYGNGDVGNQGVHETDLCMWGLGVDKLPERITSMGGKFLWDDCKEVPEVLTSIYHYPKEKKIIPSRSEKGELGLHFENWIEAIRARDMSIQNGPVQSGHLASGLAHLGNISYRLGRQLEFDPIAERFIGEGENEANAMTSRNYRAPYIVPEII